MCIPSYAEFMAAINVLLVWGCWAIASGTALFLTVVSIGLTIRKYNLHKRRLQRRL